MRVSPALHAEGNRELRDKLQRMRDQIVAENAVRRINVYRPRYGAHSFNIELRALKAEWEARTGAALTRLGTHIEGRKWKRKTSR